MGKKHKKRKKHEKYNICLGDDDYEASLVAPIITDEFPPWQVQEGTGDTVPGPLILSMRDSPGFFLGLPSGPGVGSYIGIPQDTEGNTAVVGGNGSGKSAGIAKPTLRTWKDAICATDIKGELSDFYAELYRQGLVTRPYIAFDPTQIDGPSYDPFWLLAHDSTDNLFNNIKEIAMALVPVLPDDKQPFWAETEQGVLAAALLYYFELGLSFSESITTIMAQPVSILCKKLIENGDIRVRFFLGETVAMKPETLANIDRGLRNKLMLFAADPYISHAFRGQREGANCFTWDDLNTHNIFLRIPADKIEQWSEAINLMYTQLIRHLERRPEMHSPEGAGNIQTLLLMDEFARFGKLEMITAALATLRSKNVNICLMVQSVAQLDKIYGEYDRRIIFDNCQFQAILRANDADTQKYLCELIGTSIHRQRSVSEHEDDFGDTTGYSKQLSEIRDWAVQPHELATLNDVLLLTPYGFCQVKKFQPHDEEMRSILLSSPKVIHAKVISATPPENIELRVIPSAIIRPTAINCNNSKKNEGTKMMSIEERNTNATKRIRAAEQQQLLEQRKRQEAQKRKDSRRNYIIGELVTRYFPDVKTLEPGTQDGNLARFEPLEAFLCVLSTDYDLCRELQERAAQLVSENPEGEWRMSM